METASGPTSAAVWRRRLQELARGAGKPHEPMFAPLLLGVAAQVDAITVQDMVRDATLLRKGVADLRRMLRLSALTCAVPSLMEFEALGGKVDASVWPPRAIAGSTLGLSALDLEPDALQRAARLSASVDAVRQLATADTSEPVIVVALTGPATLVMQLRAAAPAGGDAEALYELAGRLLAVLVRLYCEAGAHLVQLHEQVLPGADKDHWKGALGTAGNVARFHRVPSLLVMAEELSPPAWPPQAVPCPALDAAPLPASRAQAQCWRADPPAWPVVPRQAGPARLITTASDLPTTLPLAELLAQVQRVQSAA